MNRITQPMNRTTQAMNRTTQADNGARHCTQATGSRAKYHSVICGCRRKNSKEQTTVPSANMQDTQRTLMIKSTEHAKQFPDIDSNLKYKASLLIFFKTVNAAMPTACEADQGALQLQNKRSGIVNDQIPTVLVCFCR